MSTERTERTERTGRSERSERTGRTGRTDATGEGKEPAPDIGAALARHAGEIAERVVEGWRKGRSDMPENHGTIESEIHRVAREGTLAVADYLLTGVPVTHDRSEVWDATGEAPMVHGITLSEVTRLYLYWRALCVDALREEARLLHATEPELELAISVVQLGADTSLVRMAKRFEATREHLEALLVEKQAGLEYQALHDPLTGLANRALFVDRLGHALAGMPRRSTRLAVLFVDLDQFKTVNDTLGHAAGDQLLVEVSARLGDLIRPGDTMARLGGDELVLLCEDLHDPISEGLEVAQRIADRLRRPFRVGDRQVLVTVSIGVACGGDTDSPEVLLARADQAMYLAKQRGRGRVELYDPAFDRQAGRHAELCAAIHHAIPERRLHIAYQPVLDLRAERMVAREALLRWDHPTLGPVPPDELVPVAEQTGLMIAIGRWVLREACHHCVAWQATGNPGVGVTVNVSGSQLRSGTFHHDVAQALEESGLAPATLTVEIAETLMATHPEARTVFEQLHSTGVRIAIDDFGSGLSSLFWLGRLPLDAIKVDPSFIGGLDRIENESEIVLAMVRLAHTLGLEVVAEGVETESQLARLGRIECDKAQGYYLGRPERLSAPDRAPAPG